MAGVTGTVVGHTVLREVIRSHLLGPVSAADLCAAVGVNFFALTALFAVEVAGAQHGHGLGLVLELRPLVLADGDDAGRNMRDADGCGVLLDVLPTVAPGVEYVDAKVVLVNIDVDFVCFG